jgi:hypothetical protein
MKWKGVWLGSVAFLVLMMVPALTAEARNYHPSMGRWIERDPIGFAGKALDLYEYTHTSPPNRVDPWGTDASATNSPPVLWTIGGQMDPSLAGSARFDPVVASDEDRTWFNSKPLEDRCNSLNRDSCKGMYFTFWHNSPYDATSPTFGSFAHNVKGAGTVLDAQGIGDMIKKLDDNLKKCQCVQKLSIVTHGGWSDGDSGGFMMPAPGLDLQDGIDVVSSSITKETGKPVRQRSMDNVDAFSNIIKPVMCRGRCTINIMGCKTARGGSTLAQISKLTGCSVNGSDGDVGFNPDGTWSTEGTVWQYNNGYRYPIPLHPAGSEGRAMW